MTTSYEAVIPCCNNRGTIRAVVAAALAQSTPPQRVRVIDDGSTDGSVEALSGLPVEVVRQGARTGRGAVRARAIAEAQADLVLMCDATNTMAPDFAARALPWFSEDRVAAVFGRLSQPPAQTAAHRWRGRHLFRIDEPATVRRSASLSTWACVVRRSAALAVGNFNTALTHNEDVEFGERLAAAGNDVVFEPAAMATSLAVNSVAQVLERHWRWYVARQGPMNRRTLLRWIAYALKVMLPRDLRAGDPAAAWITLRLPWHHYRRSVKSA